MIFFFGGGAVALNMSMNDGGAVGPKPKGLPNDLPRSGGEVDDPAVGYGYAAIHAPGKFVVVRGDQRRQARLPHQCFQRRKYVRRRIRVEIASGFIGQQNEGSVCNGPSDRNPLLLPARQLGRTMIATMADAHIFQQLAGTLFCLLAGEPRNQLRHHDVFERGEFRQEMVELVDEADRATADRGALIFGQGSAGGATNGDLARIGMLQQARDVQQRRFARSDGATSATVSPLLSAKFTSFRILRTVSPCP